MSATNVPCAEWGSSRYVRTESAFHIQSCLVTQKTGALTWHTVEVVPIQRESVPEKVSQMEVIATFGIVFGIVAFFAWLVSR